MFSPTKPETSQPSLSVTIPIGPVGHVKSEVVCLMMQPRLSYEGSQSCVELRDLVQAVVRSQELWSRSESNCKHSVDLGRWLLSATANPLSLGQVSVLAPAGGLVHTLSWVLGMLGRQGVVTLDWSVGSWFRKPCSGGDVRGQAWLPSSRGT